MIMDNPFALSHLNRKVLCNYPCPGPDEYPRVLTTRFFYYYPYPTRNFLLPDRVEGSENILFAQLLIDLRSDFCIDGKLYNP